MSESNNARSLEKFGLAATLTYLLLLLVGLPTAAYFGFVKVAPITLNELGDFLAGAFGPLAIFWLVLGFFQQGRELQNSVDALNLQAEELRKSVEQQTALVSISEKQHRLELEEREEASRTRQNKEVPFLVLKQNGGGSNGREHFTRFDVVNRNGDAAKVIFETGSEYLVVSPSTKIMLLSGQECRVTVKAPNAFASYAEKSTLTTKSYSTSGICRVQVFSLATLDYPMLSQHTIPDF